MNDAALRLECLKIASAEARQGLWGDTNITCAADQVERIEAFVFARTERLVEWVNQAGPHQAAAPAEPDYERLPASPEAA